MSSAPHPSPEHAYRWVIVVVSAIILALSMGLMVNGVSVFFIPLHDEFGWQRGSVALINFSGLMGLAIGGVVMGKVADQTSTRRVCLIGAVVLGLCVLAASMAHDLWQFYVIFFVAGVFGAGSLYTPLLANVGNWFVNNPGLALGIASAGQALGQGAVPFGVAVLIGMMGWRGALVTMAVIMLIVLLPLAMLIRQPPRNNAVAATGHDVSDDENPTVLPPKVAVRWLGIAVLFCCICMSVPLIHLVPLIQDRGFSLEDAGSVIFLMLIVAILGRIAFGKLADMIGAIRAYWIASCWQTLLVVGFLYIDTLDGFYLFAAIYGFGYAGVMTGLLVCVRVLTPLARRASALGIVSLFGFLGHGIGGYQGGFFFDMTGNYTLTYTNAALAGGINLVIVAALYFTYSRRRLALAMPN